VIGNALEPQDSPGHPMAAWFEQFRADRRAGRAPAGTPRRTRAIITMVHDEPVFLPLFLRYYGRYFAAPDIYVLDNETTDGSTQRDGFVRIPVERGAVDHAWMVETIRDLQHELLGRYDVVVVCDVDEFIAPTPEWGTLGEYLDGFTEEWVNCLGYELLHDPEHEPPLDLARPVLDQRGQWYINGGYDKAAVATVPMQWRPGFHGRSDFQMKPDPDLRLVHAHRMDYGLCLERHRHRNRRPWAPADDAKGWAAHNRIVEEEAFRRWFSTDSCFEYVKIRPEPIRPSWRGVF
jgi:hypothetical protein